MLVGVLPVGPVIPLDDLRQRSIGVGRDMATLFDVFLRQVGMSSDEPRFKVLLCLCSHDERDYAAHDVTKNETDANSCRNDKCAFHRAFSRGNSRVKIYHI